MKDLHDIWRDVRDEASFVRFLETLANDWEDERRKEEMNPSSPYGPGHNGWEHGTIGAFLEAAASWTKDSQHFPNRPENPWTRAAQILLAGKYHE